MNFCTFDKEKQRGLLIDELIPIDLFPDTTNKGYVDFLFRRHIKVTQFISSLQLLEVTSTNRCLRIPLTHALPTFHRNDLKTINNLSAKNRSWYFITQVICKAALDKAVNSKQAVVIQLM